VSATGKSLTLSAQNLTLTEGEIEVAADATLDVGAQTLTMGDGALAAYQGTVTVGATNTVTLTKASIAGAGTTLVGATGTVTLAAGDMLEIVDGGTVALAGTAKVVLTGADATGGAKLVGAGKLTAGATEIVGGKDGWQAVGTSGTVTIASVTASTASITASAATVVWTAQGAGATITQLAGTSGNGLTIAAATVIALRGTNLVQIGAITLGGGTNPAVLTLANTTAKITGDTNLSTAVAANSVAITGLTVGNAVTGLTAASGTKVLGALVGAASDNTITGGADAVTINAATAIAQ
jgi:hypothetical protein